MEYNIIIAGSGFAGATIAYLAAQKGWRVLLLEKREHIAGNMYDFVDEAGILVQKYGPHSVHTNKAQVREFLSGIWDWEPYILRASAMIDGIATPSPFNFKTIDDFYAPAEAAALKQRLIAFYGGAEKVTIVEMLRCEDAQIRAYAEFLFEKDYRPYTAKQWGIPPETLDISILQRVPVRLTNVDGYFDDDWQVLPKGSFTALFTHMLDHPNITVCTNQDILQRLQLDADTGAVSFDGETLEIPLVYTGPLDELFDCQLGQLPYRSLYFDFQTLPMDSYQETAGVAHPMAEGFTRITEYTKQPPQDGHGKTTIAVEYPVAYGAENGKEAYYPILTEASQQMAQQYRDMAERFPCLHLCGRLADFRYYNMDDAVLRAMSVFEKLVSSASATGV